MNRRRVRFTATARRHVRLLSEWWKENSSSPEILEEDLAEALKMLSAFPTIGSSYSPSPVPGVRRIYLDRLTCHLYYTFDDAAVVVREERFRTRASLSRRSTFGDLMYERPYSPFSPEVSRNRSSIRRPLSFSGLSSRERS